ncbi:hypothetical protein ACMU_17900 [Actibacterium mucosum KCTC 23349]|uniref:Uncharacterized protein n=1 Tax=Actibacterium mucosum KCTC 23349 TaxID=1454373 RepID=A0A037ZIC9_9RHOB|nr:hypothetical protein ACMU_17900 [Actibacterium mucosum KCTC 23349]
MRSTFLALALTAPTFALAVGSDDFKPPKTTETTTECTDGQIYDETTKTCVDAKESSLGDDVLYQAVREFAYAGQYDAAKRAMDAMSNQQDDRVLTYRGFVNRKLGNTELAMQYYSAALTKNPDNLLARSYMGQGLAKAGNMPAARIQLSEIRARGGADTWAEIALADAIKTGVTYNY